MDKILGQVNGLQEAWPYREHAPILSARNAVLRNSRSAFRPMLDRRLSRKTKAAIVEEPQLSEGETVMIVTGGHGMHELVTLTPSCFRPLLLQSLWNAAFVIEPCMRLLAEMGEMSRSSIRTAEKAYRHHLVSLYVAYLVACSRSSHPHQQHNPLAI